MIEYYVIQVSILIAIAVLLFVLVRRVINRRNQKVKMAEDDHFEDQDLFSSLDKKNSKSKNKIE